MTNPNALVSTPEFYSWQAQDGKIRVHLSIAAVAQMQVDVQNGLKRIPKRGAEVGGILLGSAEEIKNVRTIAVHNIQSFECEYSTGPSWTLSRKDVSLLESVLRELSGAIDVEQTIVGFYRSNTRERLALSKADLDLIEKFFPEERHTFLLIQPQLGRTASIEFSYWAGGRVCSAPNRLEIRSTPGAFAGGALAAPARKAVPPASPIRSGGLHARLAPTGGRSEAVEIPTLLDTRPAAPEERPETPEISPAPHDSRQAPIEERVETAKLPALPGAPLGQREARPETPGIPPALPDTLVQRLARPETAEPLALRDTRQAPSEERPETPQIPPALPDTLVQHEAHPETAEPLVRDMRQAPSEERLQTPELPGTLRDTRQVQPEERAETPELFPTPYDTRLASPQAKPRLLPRLVYAALGIVTVAILAVAALVYQGRRAESGATALALQVERRADKLILSWNPAAVELQAAHRVTLAIRDGRDEKTLELNVQQLLAGRLYYAPATRDIKLSLELYLDNDRRVGESVHFLGDELVKPAGATAPAVAPSPSQPRAAESPVQLTPSLSAQGPNKAPAGAP